MAKDKEILLSAFEGARAWSTLLVTLATGAIVFTAVFRDKFAGKEQPIEGSGILLTAWILLGLAAIFGVVFVGNLYSILNEGRKDALTLYGHTTRIIAALQFISFFIGMGFLLAFLVRNLF